MRAGMAVRQGIGDWFSSVRSTAIEPTAKRSDSKMEKLGSAMLDGATGALIGSMTGVGSALAPDGLSPKALGIGALVALGASTALGDRPGGRLLANANVALSALAMHEYAGNKATAAAGTTTQVLTSKAKRIAAHGDVAGEMSAGADPLIEWGARKFAAAH